MDTRLFIEKLDDLWLLGYRVTSAEVQDQDQKSKNGEMTR